MKFVRLLSGLKLAFSSLCLPALFLPLVWNPQVYLEVFDILQKLYFAWSLIGSWGKSVFYQLVGFPLCYIVSVVFCTKENVCSFCHECHLEDHALVCSLWCLPVLLIECVVLFDRCWCLSLQRMFVIFKQVL